MIKKTPFTAISELELRTERALQILKFIIDKNTKENVHDNDVRRVYKVLKHGAKYERIYKNL